MADDKQQEQHTDQDNQGVAEEVEQTLTSQSPTRGDDDADKINSNDDDDGGKKSSSSAHDKKSEAEAAAATAGATLLEEEMAVRSEIENGPSQNLFCSVSINGYSAILIFIFHLISIESILSIGLSVGMTICK